MHAAWLAALFLGACAVATRTPSDGAAARPKAEKKVPPLVDVHEVVPHAAIEMRYAKSDNFLHEAVYPCSKCLLRIDAANALAGAQKDLDAKGLKLLLWDCYRPPAVQKQMWAILPDPRFVADPAKGSIHNRGGAIDVSLADAKTLEPLEMPTAHDDFTEKAFSNAKAGEAATKNRALLKLILEDRFGFKQLKTEWWHFDWPGSKEWPIEDVALCTDENKAP